MNHLFQKKNKSILLVALLVVCSFSCISNKKLIYMQDLGADSQPLIESSPRVPYNSEEYLLQANDIVEINIKTTSPELNLLFQMTNGENPNTGMMGGQNGGDVFFMNGYSLDENGIVELPLIGEVNLQGFNLKEAKTIIENSVSQYVNKGEYYVMVRLGGIRFSALGEFRMPGKQTILQNRATIFDAIAVAGDLNVQAKRDEIVLVRQYPDGSQIHKINLLDKNLLKSDFYFIRPNDLLYAQPLKNREIGSGENFLQTMTFFITTISTFVLVISLINND